MNKTKMSKFISLILRHHPEVIGISLDAHGWANVHDLLAGINADSYRFITMPMLEDIVASDEKGRYSFNADHTKIRANYGHSLPIDLELEAGIPPKILYHGTAQKSVTSISKQGLLPMERLYVHLSNDIPTATKVASRHGKPVIYQIDTQRMIQDGYCFYQSPNGIWLTKQVPVKYLEKISK